jgi:hypothetical protein
MLSFLLLTTGGYNLISNLSGTFCVPLNYSGHYTVNPRLLSEIQKEYCEGNWIMILSLPNRIGSRQSLAVQQYVNLITIIILIILFQWWRRKLRIIESQCDVLELEATDYTVRARLNKKYFNSFLYYSGYIYSVGG